MTSSRKVSFQFAVVATCLASAAWAGGIPRTYSVEDIGDLPYGEDRSAATDINENGDLSGYSERAITFSEGGFVVPTIWTVSDGLEELTPVTVSPNRFSSSNTMARAINDHRQVVGTVRGEFSSFSTAMKWTKETGREGVAASTAAAFDVNNLGEIVGMRTPGSPNEPEAMFWTSEGEPLQISISRSIARAINDSSQVTGTKYDSAGSSAFVWSREGGLQILDRLSRSTGTTTGVGINAAGQIVGADSLPGVSQRAYLWSAREGAKDLGELRGGLNMSLASGINDFGQIVGTSAGIAGNRAVLWEDGKILDLNSLIEPSDPAYGFVTLTDAVAINNSGMIAANGVDARTGASHGYRLAPFGQGVSLRLIPYPASPKTQIAYTWSGISNPSALDSVGIYLRGASRDDSFDWRYSSCDYIPDMPRPSGTCTITVPRSVARGPYEIRLFGPSGEVPLATADHRAQKQKSKKHKEEKRPSAHHRGR